MNDLFWDSSDLEREKGYVQSGDTYNCLLCEYKTEVGYIYPAGDLHVDAEKQMNLHIKKEHISVFEHLTNLEKKTTGMSEHQSKILKLFYDGISDYEVQKQLEVGSVSTIRNHRYALKEKEKQAKTLVTIMALLSKKLGVANEIIKPHKTATMVDDRYKVSLEESEKIIKKYFPNGIDGQLTSFYVKEKSKIVILGEIIKRFELKKRYTEKDVDKILKSVYLDDYVLIRRYLIQYGFMDREKDGSAYWVKEELKSSKKSKKEKDSVTMKDRKKELVREYKAKVESEDLESGVYQIKNLEDGKVFIGSSRNVHKLNGLSFQLNMGTFLNKGLQSDWNRLGEDGFLIEILESFVEDENPNIANKKIRELEKKWKEKLQPYGDKGYHKKK